MKPYLPVVKHAAVALGAGLAAFVVSVQATVALSPYWDAAADGALVALAGLGIGYAKRQSP